MKDSNNSQMIKYEDLLTRLSNKISHYLSLKDNIINNEYLEVLSDSLSIIKPIISGYRLISKKRLAFFLRGLNNEKEPSFDQLFKLYSYINSEEKAEFISETITKVLNSKSKKASFLTGIIVHRIINSNQDLTYKELICVNALSNMYDFDIDNIIIVSDYLAYITEKRKGRNNGWFALYRDFKNWCKEKEIYTDNSINLTMEKCVSAQILIKEIEVELDIQEDNPGNSSASNYESMKFTDAGNLLLSNLKYLSDVGGMYFA